MENLLQLENKALDLAQDLAHVLQQISNLHWGNGEVNPDHRASDATIELLREIEIFIDAPISEIQGSR
jgi:hypothetical protein